jgi:hypothetical protein
MMPGRLPKRLLRLDAMNGEDVGGGAAYLGYPVNGQSRADDGVC